MGKFEQLYRWPEDAYPSIGGNNCYIKSAANVLKTRYYNCPELLDLFLEDISFFYKKDEKKFMTYMGCERLYHLSPVEDFSDQKPLVDRLKRIVDKYGEVVVTIGASHIPFWIEYDPDIMNIHSKVHAFAVIGYNEKAFYILEDEKYIGQGYITADFNPSIGLIKFSDMELCMNEFFQCYDVDFQIEKEKSRISNYKKEVMHSILKYSNYRDSELVYGVQGLRVLHDEYAKNNDMHDLYDERNLIEMRRAVNNREVLKQYLCRELITVDGLDTIFEEDFRKWNTVLRLFMRRKSNEASRVYDNTSLCGLINELCELEERIIQYVKLCADLKKEGEE